MRFWIVSYLFDSVHFDENLVKIKKTSEFYKCSFYVDFVGIFINRDTFPLFYVLNREEYISTNIVTKDVYYNFISQELNIV